MPPDLCFSDFLFRLVPCTPACRLYHPPKHCKVLFGRWDGRTTYRSGRLTVHSIREAATNPPVLRLPLPFDFYYLRASLPHLPGFVLDLFLFEAFKLLIINSSFHQTNFVRSVPPF